MTDVERVDPSTADRPPQDPKPSVGKSIVASLKNRGQRLKAQLTAPASAPTDSVLPMSPQSMTTGLTSPSPVSLADFQATPGAPMTPSAPNTQGAPVTQDAPSTLGAPETQGAPTSPAASGETQPPAAQAVPGNENPGTGSTSTPPVLEMTMPTPTLTPPSVSAPSVAAPSLPPPTVPVPMTPPPVGPPPGYVGSVAGGAVQLSGQIPKAAPVKSAARPKPGRQSRRARLRVSRVDPWSVMKTALLFSVAAWIIFIVATWVVFTVLDMTGLYDAINSTVAQVFASPDQTSTFNIKKYINTTRATAIAALVGAVNVIIMTALATIFAFLYNLSAIVMGGIEVTMAED